MDVEPKIEKREIMVDCLDSTLDPARFCGKWIELHVLSRVDRTAAIFGGAITGYAKYGEKIHLQLAFPLFVEEFLKAPIIGWVLSVCSMESICTLRGLPRENVMGWDGLTFEAHILSIR